MKSQGLKNGGCALPDFERESQIKEFLRVHGWGGAARTAVPGDASARRYERLILKDKKAVLMDAPEDADGLICPIDATLGQREALGYNAQARLAGSSLSAFICLATALSRRGFHAPHIMASDAETGLLLLEDLGDELFAHVLSKNPTREGEIYQKAITCLAALYRSSFSPNLKARGLNWYVGDYDDIALQAEADLFLQWYVPYFDTPLSPTARSEWVQIWQESLTHLKAHAPGLALRDFHAENIFDLEEGVGLIDFQDALFAHPSYDLVSLLEDARRDVDPNLIAPLIAQFCDKAGIENNDAFQAAYAVQGAQRNAKILGIFIRLAVRDNKTNYLDLIPRVRAHFQTDLAHPALCDLRAWIEKYAPSALEDNV